MGAKRRLEVIRLLSRQQAVERWKELQGLLMEQKELTRVTLEEDDRMGGLNRHLPRPEDAQWRNGQTIEVNRLRGQRAERLALVIEAQRAVGVLEHRRDVFDRLAAQLQNEIDHERDKKELHDVLDIFVARQIGGRR
ncbi:MAG: hypothetical protein ACYDHP_01910 [Ferrimicrobium sp.]